MENRKNRKQIILRLLTPLIVFGILIQLFPGAAVAEAIAGAITEDIKPARARVKGVSRPEAGEVTIKRDGGWEVLYRCERVEEGDSVRVGRGGWVELRLLNKGDRIRMASSSGIVIDRMVRGGGAKAVDVSLTLENGALRIRSDGDYDSTVTVRTGNAEITVEKGDCIVRYDDSSRRSLVLVKALYEGGSVLVNTLGTVRDTVSVSEGKKVEIVGGGEGFEVGDAGFELALLGITMKFVDEPGYGKAGMKTKMLGARGEGPSVDVKGEAEDFTRKFVSYLNGENLSGIRGMVSSHYTGNIGGFGSRTALINGLRDHFDAGERSRLTYSVGNVGTTDEAGGEIIIDARIGTGDVKLWITKEGGEGGSYRLVHAEGRWFYD